MTEEDAEFYNNLDLMETMFPQYDQSELMAILEQCEGDVEQAVQLLGL